MKLDAPAIERAAQVIVLRSKHDQCGAALVEMLFDLGGDRRRGAAFLAGIEFVAHIQDDPDRILDFFVARLGRGRHLLHLRLHRPSSGEVFFRDLEVVELHPLGDFREEPGWDERRKADGVSG